MWPGKSSPCFRTIFGDPEMMLRFKRRVRVTHIWGALVKAWPHSTLTHHCLSWKRDVIGCKSLPRRKVSLWLVQELGFVFSAWVDHCMTARVENINVSLDRICSSLSGRFQRYYAKVQTERYWVWLSLRVRHKSCFQPLESRFPRLTGLYTLWALSRCKDILD